VPKAKTGACHTNSRSGSQLEFQLHRSARPDDDPANAHPTGGTANPEGSANDAAGDDGATDHDDDDSPTFVMVRESGIDGEKRCLYLVLESTQGEHFRLDFTPGCIPLAVAALSSELGFLRQHQPDLDEAVQPIVIESCQLGETASGSPALLAGMEGGGELPLQMSLTDLQQLGRQIEEYVRNRAWGRQKR